MPGGDSKTDAVWFTDAETNSTAASLNVLDLYNPSATETAWNVPAGVTSISVAVMGCGGGGQQKGAGTAKPFACGGGEMVWRNNISVTGGQTLYVHAGCAHGRSATATSLTGFTTNYLKYISDMNGNLSDWTDSAVTDYSRASYIRAWVSGYNKFLVYAAGAKLNEKDGADDQASIMQQSIYGTLGTENTDWRHNPGGDGGGTSNENTWWLNRPRGSGGAAGYTGSGGDGANSTGGDGNAGSGGGSGGGSSGPLQGNPNTQSRGGHTFMWGEGNNGAAGDFIQNDAFEAESNGGDGSKTGTGATNNPPDGLGQGGGGGSEGWAGMNGTKPEFDGWVRIVWSTDGTTRNFPSTNVAYPG
tara:strand:+ start:4839 stop:5912 length:1074 start_codon:yes stop_codon:yes gene_type:complete